MVEPVAVTPAATASGAVAGTLPSPPRFTGEEDRRRLRAALEEIAADPGEPRTLRRLFRNEEEVEASEAGAEIGSAAVEALVATGLLVREGGTLRAAARLGTVEDLWLAHDLFAFHRPEHPHWVMGPGPITRSLIRFLPASPVESTLDLGCGSGVLACVAAGNSRRVVAADVNERALAFARFNAALNGIDSIEFVAGDLYEPVAGQRFDRILANPPFALAPDWRFHYRDGGARICRRVVRGAADHLTDEGTLLVSFNWPQPEDGGWSDGVLGWFEGAGLDAWVLRMRSLDRRAYASSWLAQENRGVVPPDELARWCRYLEDRGVASVGFGVALAGPAAAAEPSLEARNAPPGDAGGLGPSLERVWAARRFLRRTADPADLLDVPLVPAPALERVDRRRPSGSDPGDVEGPSGGWGPPRTELRLAGGLHFSGTLDPVGTELVGRLGAHTTPRAEARRLAGELLLPDGALVGNLPALLERLLSVGLVQPPAGAPTPETPSADGPPEDAASEDARREDAQREDASPADAASDG